MAFIPSYKGSLKVTPQQCETAHVRGYMNVSLGQASMYMSGLIPGISDTAKLSSMKAMWMETMYALPPQEASLMDR